MYIILGKDKNYVPVTNVKSVTPIDSSNSKVILNSGEQFLKDGTPEEIFKGVTNMPQDYTFVVNSFAQMVTTMEDSLKEVNQNLVDYKNEVHSNHCSSINGLDNLKNKYNDSKRQVGTAVAELNNSIKELKTTDLLFNNSRRSLEDTLNGLEELLKSETDSLDQQEKV